MSGEKPMNAFTDDLTGTKKRADDVQLNEVDLSKVYGGVAALAADSDQ